jgi:hypothetical protein
VRNGLDVGLVLAESDIVMHVFQSFEIHNANHLPPPKKKEEKSSFIRRSNAEIIIGQIFVRIIMNKQVIPKSTIVNYRMVSTTLQQKNFVIFDQLEATKS